MEKLKLFIQKNIAIIIALLFLMNFIILFKSNKKEFNKLNQKIEAITINEQDVKDIKKYVETVEIAVKDVNKSLDKLNTLSEDTKKLLEENKTISSRLTNIKNKIDDLPKKLDK